MRVVQSAQILALGGKNEPCFYGCGLLSELRVPNSLRTHSAPLSHPSKKTSRPSGQPILAFRLNVACPSCGSIASYTTADCHFEEIQRDLLRSDLTGKVVVSALRPCGDINCESHIEILTLMASGLTASDIYPIIRSWHFPCLEYCRSGHQLSLLPPDSHRVRFLDY